MNWIDGNYAIMAGTPRRPGAISARLPADRQGNDRRLGIAYS